MRATASLFVNDPSFTIPYNERIKEMQKMGVTPSEYLGELDGKKIKLWLPEDVREQYQAVFLAEAMLNTTFNTDIKHVLKVNMDLWELAKKHMLVDDEEGFKKDDNDFTVEFIEAIIALYMGELLLPLFHRSSMKATDALIKNLKPYIKEPAKS